MYIYIYIYENYIYSPIGSLSFSLANIVCSMCSIRKMSIIVVYGYMGTIPYTVYINNFNVLID